MVTTKNTPEHDEPEPERANDDQELDLSELEQIVGGAGGVDEVGLQNHSVGRPSGWWNDPNL